MKSVPHRLYRLLLHLYPAEFRRAYGDLMAQAFQDLYRQAECKGSTALLRLWAVTLADLVLTALYEHWCERKSIMNKRLFDVVASSVALALLLLVLAIIALLIRLDSPGPILFVQERAGRGGKAFRMYKFRTMMMHTEHLPTDQRLTAIGRWLRKTSLDELPQLVNVLKGDMSLIGPRPPLAREVVGSDTDWLAVLAIRPGITGLAQVSDYNHLDREARQAAQREHDRRYLRDQSLWLDVQVIARTVRWMIRPKRRDD